MLISRCAHQLARASAGVCTSRQQQACATALRKRQCSSMQVGPGVGAGAWRRLAARGAGTAKRKGWHISHATGQKQLGKRGGCEKQKGQ
eukprot:scaffold72132_cov17-Tisochrysis_lutea.AAC.1